MHYKEKKKLIVSANTKKYTTYKEGEKYIEWKLE